MLQAVAETPDEESSSKKAAFCFIRFGSSWMNDLVTLPHPLLLPSRGPFQCTDC